jgi:membrane associated rhomboid family serine protease
MLPASMAVLKRFVPIVALVALCWLVFGLNELFWHGNLNRFGIIPRHFSSLPGILWSPFLHVSVAHLTANTLPLLILGAILCGRSLAEFFEVVVVGILLTGLLTWIFGRTASHVGASGLIFCFFGYITSMAYFRRTFGTLLLSVVCLIGYGGMLKGVLPTSAPVSWEGHAAGLVAGIALAWIWARLTPQSPGIKTSGNKPLVET